MFQAINSKTLEIINSIDPNYTPEFFSKEEWYADPLYIESCDEEVNKEKIVVKYRKGADEVINKFGTIYDIAPHFYIPNVSKIGIIVKKDNVTHKKCVNFLYNLIRDGEINFYISKSGKYNDNIKNLYILDTKKIDYSRFDVEVTIKKRGWKRADIFLPLKKYDKLIGFGIVIEIQLTDQSDNTQLERSFNYANKGYSVCWLRPDNFDDIYSNNLILLNNDIYIEDYTTILSKYKKKCIDDIKEITLNYSRMLTERENRIEKLSEEIKRPKAKDCPRCENGILTIKTNRDSGNEFYGCSNFKYGCKFTIPLK